MSLLRHLGYRHKTRVPLAMWGYISELTQSVGCACDVMISWTVISLSCAYISPLGSMGTLHLQCYTDRMLGSSVMEYLPYMLPILPKESGNMLFRSSMLWRALWSCNVGTVSWWSCWVWEDQHWWGYLETFFSRLSGVWHSFLHHCWLLLFRRFQLPFPGSLMWRSVMTSVRLCFSVSVYTFSLCVWLSWGLSRKSL